MSWLERFRELSREFGPALAIKRLIKKILSPLYFAETLVMLSRELGPELEEPVLPEGFQAQPIQEQDLLRIVSDLELGRQKLELFKRRLQQGITGFFVTGEGGKAVYTTWFGPGPRPDPETLYAPELPKTDILLIDSYCHPRVRKLKLHSAMTKFRLRRAFEQGFVRAWAIYYSFNIPAEKAQQKAGMQPIKKIRVIRLFGHKIIKVHDLGHSEPAHGL